METYGGAGTRPWGRYEVLSEETDHKVKRIVVLPGKRMSLQVHERRTEHWLIVRGGANVTLGSHVIPLRAGQSIDVPKGETHRIENPGRDDLVLIEIQTGSYFGEDDIRRIEDDFGRC